MEGLLCLPVILLVVVLEVELWRRAQYEASLHLATFVWTRGRALGVVPAKHQSDVRALLKAVLGERSLPPLHLSERSLVAGGMEGKLHFRFPALLALPRKHHYEITKRCPFFF